MKERDSIAYRAELNLLDKHNLPDGEEKKIQTATKFDNLPNSMAIKGRTLPFVFRPGVFHLAIGNNVAEFRLGPVVSPIVLYHVSTHGV